MRTVGHILAALCLALRLAIPAGYMVDGEASLNAAWPLVLCTGEGAWQGAHHHHHHHHHEGSGSAQHRPCPFAGLFAAAPPEPEFSFTKDEAGLLISREAIPTHQWRIALAAPPPPAQGPPFLL